MPFCHLFCFWSPSAAYARYHTSSSIEELSVANAFGKVVWDKADETECVGG